MINEQDYTKTEKDGVITFTPKKKEGERSRRKQGEKFYYVSINWCVDNLYECRDSYWEKNFLYWNYYHTEEQAQAVADLRRHVYKFPAVNKDNYMYYSIRENKWCVGIWYGLTVYSFDVLPITATDEDQEERTRLIKRCYELNGYVTI